VRAKAVKLLLLVALSTMFLSLGAQVSAQEEKPAAETKKAAAKGGDKKKTNIDFEDELVEGELKKPELFYLLQKKQFNFKRLIKLREDFLPEMRRDADEIRRGGSKK
jgi:hypothetical protein